MKNFFKPSIPCQFKADFAIENKQDSPEGTENTADIKTLRYWTTNVYRVIYFNSFVAAGIRHDILRRVINNRLSGSSWYFNRFSHLNVKVLKKGPKTADKMADFIDFEAEASENNEDEMIDDSVFDDPMMIDDSDDLPNNEPSFYRFCNHVADPAEFLSRPREEQLAIVQQLEPSNYLEGPEDLEEEFDEEASTEINKEKFLETLKNPVSEQTKENSFISALVYAINYHLNKEINCVF